MTKEREISVVEPEEEEDVTVEAGVAVMNGVIPWCVGANVNVCFFCAPVGSDAWHKRTDAAIPTCSLPRPLSCQIQRVHENDDS